MNAPSSLHQPNDNLHTTITYTLYLALALYALHQLLLLLYNPTLPAPQELLWHALVHLLPARLLLTRTQRQDLAPSNSGMLSQTHAAKSEALRRLLGVGGQAMLQSLPAPAEGIARRMSGVGGAAGPGKPPGLGNWDNSCYQNSVLQGLASLGSLAEWLARRAETGGGEDGTTTTEALRRFVGSLNDGGNWGRCLWTPARLKSMSSWQQQDAQEYYSKVLDELDKEATKAVRRERTAGLEGLLAAAPSQQDGDVAAQNSNNNPLDGLLAQRVACTACGHSEGLSLIPFNCLTLPLGSAQPAYTLESCLSASTALETIPSVDCSKCTLVHSHSKLSALLPPPPSTASRAITSSTLALPPELRAQAFQRLARMQRALETDDFTDATLHQSCQIATSAKVSAAKTRQSVVARAPAALALHLNRSVFDEATGTQRKNYAAVLWPARLDLGRWVLRADAGAGGSLLNDDGDDDYDGGQELVYTIKAVVTHYGRHENGHYICYRRYPGRRRARAEEEELDGVDEDGARGKGDVGEGEVGWWRLSDEDVTAVEEEEVLRQGGVFMLFYERERVPETPEGEGAAGAEVAAAEAEAEKGERSATAHPNEADAGRQPESPTPALPATEGLARAQVTPSELSPALSSSVEPDPSAAASTTPPPAAHPAGPASTAKASREDEQATEASSTLPTEAALEPEPKPSPRLPQQPAAAAAKSSPPPAMRTARSHRAESPPGSTSKDGGFAVGGVGGGGMRVVAAT